MNVLKYLPNSRLTFFIIFLVSCGAMASMLYMQYAMALIPCALCVTQRGFMISLGLVGLAAAIHNPKAWGRKVYAALGLIASLGGVYFANHHRWIQGLPEDQVPACGPGLDYMLDNFPLTQVLELLLRGDGNCHDILWTFLGLSIPGWALLGFVCLSAAFVWQIIRRA